MVTNSAINTAKPIGVSDGGVGADTLLDHGVLVGSGSAAVTALTVGATGEVMVGSTGADPSFSATVLATTFDTNVVAAGVTLAGTTLSTDGTDANIPLVCNGKGTGPLQTTLLGVGTATVPHGGVGGGIVAIEGANASISGPHMQVTTATDDYPLFQLVPWQHDDITLYFDCYYDGTNRRSSSANANTRIVKGGSGLSIDMDEGTAQGDVVTFARSFFIDQYGHVTKPLQSAFHASVSGDNTNVTGDATVFTVIFGTETFDQNSDYAVATGIFTAPVTGRYLFTSHLRLEDLAVGNTGGDMIINTTGGNYYVATLNPGAIQNAGFLTIGGSVICSMTATDTAYVQVTIGGGTKIVDISASGSGDVHSFFSGSLIC